MKNCFPGYVRKSDKELAKLWAECVFAFDASFLLDLYRVKPLTCDEILGVLDQFQQRVWLPHQAALEYYDNRLQVISKGQNSFARIPQLADEAAHRFRETLESFGEYRWIELERWTETLENAAKQIREDLAKEEKQARDFLKTDPVQQKIIELFSQRVGKPYTDLDPIYRQAELRFQLSVPPGFRDAAIKKDYRRYGDVVLWFQLMDFAKAEKKGIVFVTSDLKPDWWQEESGKKIGPRPELVQEIYAKTGAAFHLYSSDQFIQYAKRFLKIEEKPKVIHEIADELKEVSKQKELFRGVAEHFESVQLAKMLRYQYPFGEVLDNIRAFQQELAVNPIAESLRAIQQELAVNPIAESFRAIQQELAVNPISHSIRALQQQLAAVAVSPIPESIRAIQAALAVNANRLGATTASRVDKETVPTDPVPGESKSK
jgi:hypothetical protein